MDLCNIYNCISVKFVFLLSGDLVISFVRGWLFSDLLIRTELPNKDIIIDQLFLYSLSLTARECYMSRVSWMYRFHADLHCIYKMYRFHCKKWGLLQWYMWQQLSCYWLYLGILAKRFILCIIFYIFHLCCKVTCGSNSHCISIFSSWNASTSKDTKWRSNDKSTWRSRIFILFLASSDVQLQIQEGVQLFQIKHDFVLKKLLRYLQNTTLYI